MVARAVNLVSVFRSPERYESSLRFDWIALILAAWYEGGFFFDGWAHTHLNGIDTIFTPWHALLYSGFAAITVFLLGTVFLNHRKGMRWVDSVPRGYELSIAGIALFLLGAPIDLTYHYFYGIEQNLDAIITPTHLSFAVSITLIATGPLRAAWRRLEMPSDNPYLALGPAIVSLTMAMTMLTFFTLYIHPYVVPVAANSYLYPNGTPNDYDRAFGIAGVLLESAVVMGSLLLIVRRWRLPPGTFTAILSLNTIEMLTVSPANFWQLMELVSGAVFAGLAADVLYWWLKPSVERPTALRVFSFAVPVIIYVLYFLVLQAYVGIWWSFHFWLGASLEAGVVGFLLSYLVCPPPIPASSGMEVNYRDPLIVNLPEPEERPVVGVSR